MQSSCAKMSQNHESYLKPVVTNITKSKEEPNSKIEQIKYPVPVPVSAIPMSKLQSKDAVKLNSSRNARTIVPPKTGTKQAAVAKDKDEIKVGTRTRIVQRSPVKNNFNANSSRPMTAPGTSQHTKCVALTKVITTQVPLTNTRQTKPASRLPKSKRSYQQIHMRNQSSVGINVKKASESMSIECKEDSVPVKDKKAPGNNNGIISPIEIHTQGSRPRPLNSNAVSSLASTSTEKVIPVKTPAHASNQSRMIRTGSPSKNTNFGQGDAKEIPTFVVDLAANPAHKQNSSTTAARAQKIATSSTKGKTLIKDKNLLMANEYNRNKNNFDVKVKVDSCAFGLKAESTAAHALRKKIQIEATQPVFTELNLENQDTINKLNTSPAKPSLRDKVKVPAINFESGSEIPRILSNQKAISGFKTEVVEIRNEKVTLNDITAKGSAESLKSARAFTSDFECRACTAKELSSFSFTETREENGNGNSGDNVLHQSANSIVLKRSQSLPRLSETSITFFGEAAAAIRIPSKTQISAVEVKENSKLNYTHTKAKSEFCIQDFEMNRFLPRVSFMYNYKVHERAMTSHMIGNLLANNNYYEGQSQQLDNLLKTLKPDQITSMQNRLHQILATVCTGSKLLSKGALLFQTGEQLEGTLKITNTYDSPICFRVRASENKRYRIQPCVGYLDKARFATIQIITEYLSADPMIKYDLFTIESFIVSKQAGVVSLEKVEKMWQTIQNCAVQTTHAHLTLLLRPDDDNDSHEQESISLASMSSLLQINGNGDNCTSSGSPTGSRTIPDSKTCAETESRTNTNNFQSNKSILEMVLSSPHSLATETECIASAHAQKQPSNEIVHTRSEQEIEPCLLFSILKICTMATGLTFLFYGLRRHLHESIVNKQYN